VNTSLQALFNTSQIATLNFNLRLIDILIYSLDCNGVLIFLRFFKMQKKRENKSFFHSQSDSVSCFCCLCWIRNYITIVLQ